MLWNARPVASGLALIRSRVKRIRHKRPTPLERGPLHLFRFASLRSPLTAPVPSARKTPCRRFESTKTDGSEAVYETLCRARHKGRALDGLPLRSKSEAGLLTGSLIGAYMPPTPAAVSGGCVTEGLRGGRFKQTAPRGKGGRSVSFGALFLRNQYPSENSHKE